MFWVRDYVIHIGTKGGGGNEDIVISTGDRKNCSVYEYNNEGGKVYCQMLSKNTYSNDRWFSWAKIADDEISEGVDYCGPEKTSHKGFWLSTLEKINQRVAGRVSTC